MKETQEISFYQPFIEAVNDGRLPQEVEERRRRAAQTFLETGFLNSRDEAWRFTDISPIRSVSFRPAGPAAVPNLEPFLLQQGVLRATFVNGRLVGRPNSLPKGVTITALSEAIEGFADKITPWLAGLADGRNHGFAALNTALMNDGAFLYVADGTIVEQPIELLFLAVVDGEPVMTLPRNLFLIGKAAQTVVVERYAGIGKGVHLTNAVSEAMVGEGAVLRHLRLNEENSLSHHIGLVAVRQERAASYISHQATLGGRIVRNDLHAVLHGEGSECILNGLYVTSGEQLVDNHTLIEHVAPRSSSRELYKGILADRSRAVFCGKIYVHKSAQKTDAVQSNKNLLLTDEAVVDTQPQLEIYADDVRCTHGGTVGQLDADALFYLRSRGIDGAGARRLLIHAFAGEVLETLPDSMRERMARRVAEQLEALV